MKYKDKLKYYHNLSWSDYFKELENLLKLKNSLKVYPHYLNGIIYLCSFYDNGDWDLWTSEEDPRKYW